MDDIDGWNKNARLVLSELKRLNDDIKELDKKLDRVIVAVAVLKIKYGLLGGLIGSIPGIIALIKGFL